MRLASFTPCFLEHSLWGKPTTMLEDQLLRLSGCEEVASGYFESLPGERWSARARYSSHLKAGARHVSGGKNKNKNHLRCGEGPRATAELRPQSALFRLAHPLGHSPRPQLSLGVRGERRCPCGCCLTSWPVKLCASENDFHFHPWFWGAVCAQKWITRDG